jgi:RNA polymerase sigma-70 factor, ECF subfamily
MEATHALRASETDEALMKRVTEGDTLAFEAIYDRYSGQAYSLARSIAGSAGSAEEATQDAFLSLWRRAATFDPKRGSLSTWLLMIVRYRSIDLLRQSTPRVRRESLDERAAERIEAPERTEEQVIAMQEYRLARGLVAELPPEQREVIDLTYVAGYSQTEIAAKVGIPLGTVKGRSRLALYKLRGAAERELAPVAAG